MLDFLIDKETKAILKEFIKEMGILNEHLSDIKTMIAPILGWRVKQKGESYENE